MANKKLLICDLDNTLYDWVSYFVPSLNALVSTAVEIMSCDRERLLDDLRVVHQKHKDSEHPFALLETKTVQEHYKGYSQQQIAAKLDEAFYAFNSTRKKTIRLYPGVEESLEILSSNDVNLAAYTDSKLYGAVDRLTRLNIIDRFDHIYCRERATSMHPIKKNASLWEERIPSGKVFELSHHQSKPDPTVLLEICKKQHVSPSETAYIGDSMSRDILMAKWAGVCSIWAQYGVNHDLEMYRDLVRVSHWTDIEINREKDISKKSKGIVPDFICKYSFSEVIFALNL